MTRDIAAFNFGKALACAGSGTSVEHLDFLEKVAATLEDENNPHFGIVSRIWATAGARVFEKAGAQDKFAYSLMRALEVAPKWHAIFDEFVEPVKNAFVALREHTKEEQAEFEEHVKAAGVGAFLPGMAAMAAPEMAKLLLMAPALGGVGAGSLYWLLSRQAQGNDAKEQLMEARVKQYKRIADTVEDELARKGIVADSVNAKPEDVL